MTKAGWYPSPSTPGMEQFWDGGNWTPQLRPLSATPFADPPAHQTDTVREPSPGHQPFTEQQAYPGQQAFTEQPTYPGQQPVAGRQAYPGQQPFAGQQSDGAFPSTGGAPAPASSSSGFAKVLIASLAVVAALFVGGLAFYLVSSSNSEPEVQTAEQAGTANGDSSPGADPTTVTSQPEAISEPDGEGQADPGSGTPVDTDSIALGEVLDTGAFRFLVHEVAQVEAANEFSGPDDGKVFVVVDFEITNASDEIGLFNSFDTEAFDDNGFSYDGDFSTPRRNSPLGYVVPGQTRRGDITFQIPEGTSLSYLVVKSSNGDRTPHSLSLTGESAGATSTASDGSTPTPPTDLVAFGEEVETPTFRYLVHEATPFESEDIFGQPQEGYGFIVVDLEVTNLTDEAQTSTIFDVEAFDANGFSYRADFVSPRNEPPFGDFLVGQNRRGDLTFRVPDGTEISYLVIAGFLSDDGPRSLSVE